MRTLNIFLCPLKWIAFSVFYLAGYSEFTQGQEAINEDIGDFSSVDSNTIDEAVDPNVDSLERMAQAQEAAARQQANMLAQDSKNNSKMGNQSKMKEANASYIKKLEESDIPSSMTQDQLNELAKTQSRVVSEFNRINTTAIVNVP